MFEISDEIKYKALVEKDKSYEGSFYAAIKTTGIFCRPTCTARKPLQKNVVFFDHAKEALAGGYRPCKVCRPLEKPGHTPDYIEEILSEIQKDPSVKINEQDLKSRGIDPARIRRWFIKYHGISFQAYQRTMSINQAFEKIRSGEKVTDAAYDAGYESLSGFADSFKKITGSSPSASKEKIAFFVRKIVTPIGDLVAISFDDGLCFLEFNESNIPENEILKLKNNEDIILVEGEHPILSKLELQLQEYFEGDRKDFEIQLHVEGTEFQKSVWSGLTKIPYGTTRSYKEQSIALNNPKAIRAVASANGQNKIAILIPCHRVIGGDGSLTGYAGGLWRKKFLLDLEKANS